MHVAEAGVDAAWCHGCLLHPRLLCSCWLFSSTEQHDIAHFHIWIKVEHFKAMFAFLFVCFWKKDLFFRLFFVCWVCVCELDMCFNEHHWTEHSTSIHNFIPIHKERGSASYSPWETWLLTQSAEMTTFWAEVDSSFKQIYLLKIDAVLHQWLNLDANMSEKHLSGLKKAQITLSWAWR